MANVFLQFLRDVELGDLEAVTRSIANGIDLETRDEVKQRLAMSNAERGFVLGPTDGVDSRRAMQSCALRASAHRSTRRCQRGGCGRWTRRKELVFTNDLSQGRMDGAVERLSERQSRYCPSTRRTRCSHRTL